MGRAWHVRKKACSEKTPPLLHHKPVGMNITRRPPQGLRTPGADEGIFIPTRLATSHFTEYSRMSLTSSLAVSFRARGTNPNILPHWQVCPFAFSDPIALMQYGASNSGFGFKPDSERSVQAAGDDFPTMNPSAWLTDNSARAWADHWRGGRKCLSSAKRDSQHF